MARPARRLLVILCASSALPLPAAEMTSLDVKPGAWETTVTTNVTNVRMPPEQLAQIPPERRAAVLENLKKAPQGPRTFTEKNCVTTKDLKEGAFKPPEDDEDGCKYTVVSSTPRRQELVSRCADGAGKGEGRMVIEAPDSTHVHGTIENKSSNGDLAMKLEARWLGASCAGIDDD